MLRTTPLDPKNRNDVKLLESRVFVEADSYATSKLWSDWHSKISWEQDNEGMMRQIGFIDKKCTKGVSVQFSFVMIDGIRLCFYNASSRYVDWNMVEEYIKLIWKTRNKTEPTMVDASNFHNAVGAIRRINEARAERFA